MLRRYAYAYEELLRLPALGRRASWGPILQTGDSRDRCEHTSYGEVESEHVMQPASDVAHCALVREIVPVVNVNCRAYLVAELARVVQ